MPKPFRFDELLARVRTRLRTAGHRAAARPQRRRRPPRPARPAGRRSASGTVELTAREFSLLETFLRHPDQVLTREQLLSHVWGYFFDPQTNLVNVYVGALRKKLGPT